MRGEDKTSKQLRPEDGSDTAIRHDPAITQASPLEKCNQNLMMELSKIQRVIKKVVADAPHEVLLVLDGSTGQNAFIQAEQFSKVTDINGLIVTKLDGTSKGGAIIGISSKMKIPIKYIGVGEAADDLIPFVPEQYLDLLLFDKNLN